MNHIYKVIWNHAKHCYTVVSEIAKNHSTSSVTKKKVSIAVILAAGMLSGFSPMVSGAADTTAVVYNEDKTSMKSTNSGSVGKNAIALGKRASAVDDSIAIGNGAYTQNGTLTYGQSVALGNGAVTGAKSTSIGAKAVGGREGTITIGANANNGALYATIVGTDSSINYGSRNSGAVSTVIGSKNSIKNDDKTYSGVASSILGAANTIENSNGVTIQGTGNTVTGAYKDMNLNGSDLGKLFWGDYSVLAEKESGAIAIIGGANTISSQTSSTVIGFGNTLEGKNSEGVFTAGSHNTLTNVFNSLVMGDNNTLEGRKNVISLGNNNTVTADDAVAIGNGAKVEAENGVAIGVGSVADRVAGSEKGARGAFAPDIIPKAEESTWISTRGAFSVGDTVGDITRQITNVAAGSEDTDAVNVAQLKQVNSKAETAQAEAAKGWNISTDGRNETKVAPGETVVFAGDSNIGVSNNGKNVKVELKKDLAGLTSVTTKNAYVTNVDASKDDSVTNVEYVKNQIADAALSAGDGISISDKKINVKLKDGEENLAVDKTGLSMKKDLTGMQSITGAGGGKISFADGNVTVNQNTFASDGRIQNVAAGTTDSDAVNYGQLKAVNETAAKGWNVSTNSGTATKVAPGETVDFAGDSNIGVSNNGKNVKVELKKDLAGLTSVTTKNAYVTNVDASKDDSVTNVEYVKNQIADAALSAGDGISISDKKINVKLKDGEENLKVDADGLSLNKDMKGITSITGAGNGKITFAGGNVTVNNVTFNSDGRIQKVAAGIADTDAVNVGQLKTAVEAGNTDTHIKAGEYSIGADNKVAMDVVDKTDTKIGTVTITDVAKASDVGDVSQIHTDLTNKDGSKTTVVDAVNHLDNKVGDLNYSQVAKGEIADGDSTTTAIGKLDKKLSDVSAVAGQHSSVSTKDTNIQIQEGTNVAGGKDYALSLNKNQQLTSVTTGETKMDTNGIQVGDKVSLTKEGLTAGDTKITNDGLSIGDKTYVTKDGLNASQQIITNVADGKVEKDSKDAVNGGQLYNTNQAVIQNTNTISKLGNALGKLDHRVNKVGAGAAALAALHPLDFDPDDKWDFAAGYGNYSGANAAAIGAYYRPNEDTMFSVGGSFGNGENMVNAGVSLKLGQSNHTSASKAAMEKKISALSQEVEELKAAIADLRAAQTKAKDATEKDAQKK